MIRRLLLGLFATAAGGACLSAADWPQWRGPARDGKSAETGLLKAWPAGGPKLLWKVENVGVGYGQPAVIGDKLYILGSAKSDGAAPDSVLCLNVKDASKVWGTEIGTSPGKYSVGQWGGGPRNTPTVDGDLLYVLGATGDLVCLKTADGSKVWAKNLVKDFGGQIPIWGYAESVLIDGDTLVCTPGKGTGMLALNKKTGDTVWLCKDFKDTPGYSSIMISTVGDVKQYVQQTMSQAVGVRANDGKLLWKAGGINRGTAVIPTPVLDDSVAFFTAGYGAGCELVEMKADGKGGVDAKLKYTANKTLANHHGGVIKLGDYVYGHHDNSRGAGPTAQWVCFDYKKGPDEPKWAFKGFDKGSITYADGHFYCYGENKGDLALVEASPESWKEVGRFTLPEKSAMRPNQGKFWPHPVVANGMLLVRDYEKLFAYNVKAAAE